MNLIAYSDSEGSDTEAPPPLQPATKPAFQKVVDRANPGRIKLNLTSASNRLAVKDDVEAEGPPAKKARTGGAFGGFNDLLPAPKKPNVNAATGGATGGALSGKRGPGKGLGSGVNLKTGAEPAFKREPKVDYDEDGTPLNRSKEDFRAMLNLPPPRTEAPAAATLEVTTSEAEVKPVAMKPRFVPMSVGRGKKKKAAVPRQAVTVTEEVKPMASTAISTTGSKPAARPKVSLFSVSQGESTTPVDNTSNGEYQLLYGADEDDEEVPNDNFDEASASEIPTSVTPSATSSTLARPQDLTNIASELNLSESEKRQLFGRKGRGPDLSSSKIVDFNLDTEYEHNERLRQQGETAQHNALKSISGTGKNSLKSLISVATTQKDALEEHFATGRRNKREAGNKYGW